MMSPAPDSVMLTTLELSARLLATSLRLTHGTSYPGCLSQKIEEQRMRIDTLRGYPERFCDFPAYLKGGVGLDRFGFNRLSIRLIELIFTMASLDSVFRS